MRDLTDLHRYARAIFDHALSSVDPRKAIKQSIRVDGAAVDVSGLRLDASARPIYAVAIGKAATTMAVGLEETLAGRLAAGVVVSSTPLHSQCWQSFAGGHPLPNEQSLAAAQAVFALLDRANDEEAVVIFLMSGGGSAMIEWPASNEISLADLRAANQDLISCGASITEVNAVRRAFSAVKGGGLARRAPRAQQFTLIVSDTNPGDEASVASGPTLAAPRDAPNAIEVVEHYHLDSVLPQSILKAVRTTDISETQINGSHIVLLDNRTAMNAARHKALEFVSECVMLEDVCEQPIQEGCDLFLSALSAHSTFCAISAGEFSCPVRGDGRGGRNLETVLRCAIALDNHPQHIVVLSAGTDGIDGNSPAAGAIADETTLTRAHARNLDAEQYLARSDSYTFFEQLDDLVITGPTGTNVRDLRVLLKFCVT